MANFIEITPTNGQFYYDLSYFTAIILAGVFFMIDGRHKKYPTAEWSLIFSSGIIFLIIGTKLFTYTPGDWNAIINTYQFPYTERKTILGGILGGIAGIWIAKKMLRFQHPVLDSFAVSLPAAMAVQRIGCFMAGCCFGVPADVPWAIKYAAYTHPWYAHVQSGLVDAASDMSAPVHPNQLYQTVLCLLIAFGVWKLRNVWKRPGNLFFTSVVFYWAARFIVEFWRDADSNGMTGMEWAGIKYVQWFLLAGIILMVPFLLLRERMYKPEARISSAGVNPVWYFILLCIFIVIAADWFTKTEFLFIQCALIPVTLLQASRLMSKKATGLNHRIAYLYSLLFVLTFTGTITAQKSYEEFVAEKKAKSVFNDVSLGYGYYQYGHYHADPVYHQGGGCMGPPPSYSPSGSKYIHTSHAFGGSFSQVRTFGKFQRLTMTGTISAGSDTEKDKPETRLKILDVSSSVKYDFRWFGASFGVHSGRNTNEKETGGIPFATENSSSAYTSFSGSIRVFPYDMFYAQLRLNDVFPFYLNNHRAPKHFQVDGGSEFGLENSSAAEFGYDNYGGPFISGKTLIRNRYGLQTTLYTGSTKQNESAGAFSMMQLSLFYRFNNHKTEKNADK